jgi:uncharacterized protein (TIGR04255 family)
MGTPLKNPPVYFTVLDLRFNTLLKLGDYLPSIQERMRREGFPDFAIRRTVAIQTTMQDGLPQASAPTTTVVEHFVFGTADKTHRFVLGVANLALLSTRYASFEAFSDKFINGLENVHKIVNLDFIERIGLRYLDQIAPKQDDALEQYLAPEVMGVRDRLGGDLVHAFSESVNRYGPLQLRSRVVVQDSPIAIAPDLAIEQDMAIESRFRRNSGLHAILDTDGFFEGRVDFSIGTVRTQLQDIHDLLSHTFSVLVTDHARKVWNEQ